MDEVPPPGRKTVRRNPRNRPTLAEPLIVREWKKTRSGDTARVTLSTFDGTNVVDIRTWIPDAGYRKPGKGFCCHCRHLPTLADAINAALAKALVLGLIEGEVGE